jgi:hypothetical protein
MAQPYVSDINLLREAHYYTDKVKAIALVSHISVKYEAELQKIAFYVSARPVARGDINELYYDYSYEDFYDDINYLSKCIVIIALVRLRMVPSLEYILENSLYTENDGLFITLRTLSEMCSGATLS